jgi:LPXTG-site transpeptidase (sortase) family protein
MFKDLKIFFQIFFIIFIISFLIFNGAAFFHLVNYKINKLTDNIKQELVRTPSFLADLSSDPEILPPISNIISGGLHVFNQSAELSSQVINLPAIPIEAESSNILEMPQFNIQVPILQVETPNSDIIYAKLKQGVVLYPGSDIPGKGYSIIIGHSSQYPWSPGRYKSVFSLLNELEQGDRVYVFWDQKPLVFEVKDKNIFLPWPKGTESTETIFPPSDEITLILQSCWPVGVASKRVAVKTVLVR